jgi:hypothetical protein
MAGTTDDNSIPAGDWWLLLSDLLAFVTKCLRSEVAAKRFLLDYFATHPIEWRYECTAGAPQSTIPGIDRIPTVTQGAAAIYYFFGEAVKKDGTTSIGGLAA